MPEQAGRSDSGHISVRSHFRGSKKLSRHIDFRRHLMGERGRIIRFENDSTRSAHLALLFFNQTGLFSYIISPEMSKFGSVIGVSKIFPEKNRKNYVGWSYPMGVIPISLHIYNIEIRPNKGGLAARSAGVFGYVSRKYPIGHKSYNFVGVRLPSGRTTISFRNCLASLGRVSNRQHHLVDGLLASSSFYKGFGPHVRGVAMNPIDHPHGGGEGKTSGGRPSVSKWGRPTKGYITRSREKILFEKKLENKKKKKEINDESNNDGSFEITKNI